MLSQDELHQKVLYPVLRIRTAQAGGSGVLVYSREDPRRPGQFINIALTCEHVIDDAIKVYEEWDPILKRDVKRDFLEEVSVEVFDYLGSKLISANATRGIILAYDKRHDLAAVRLLNPKPMPFTASIIPKDDIERLWLFDPVYVAGCSLLHDPFATPGQLTYLREIIDQKAYLMASASAIFGNSGGGLFHGNTGHLLGLVSRVKGVQLGFGVDIITWMNFSTHPERLYQFFQHHELQFLYDPQDDYYAAEERRERRRKEGLRALLLEPPKEENPFL